MVALLALSPAAAFADSQRVLRYEYDGAGNIVRIVAADNLAPPTIGALNPGYLDQGAQIDIVASGTNLVGAQVSTTAPGLTIVDVVPVSDTQVRFTLQAGVLTPLGLSDLEFTTALGSTSAAMLVAERLPIISSIPNPIAVSVAAPPTSVVLVFDAPFAEDRTFDLSMRDASIATLSASSVVLPAGAVQITVTVDGLAVGTSAFEVSDPEDFRAVSVPVFISDAVLSPAAYVFTSPGVGVSIVSPPAVLAGAAISQPLGVVTVRSASHASDLASHATGLTLGPVADALLPVGIARDTSETLTLFGGNLDEVSAVQFSPAEGIAVTGPLVPAPDGTALQVPVSVSTGAAIGPRAITLSSPQGVTPPNIELEITP